ncbi:MAG TPA: Rrf2 family transcriptional regulator [Sedimentisphaerales bacterium]|nr:Rrf2 family transcriptional regulator [Sedimentisphaerales bacterium]
MQISPLTIYAIQALQEIRRQGAMPCEEIARSLNISRAYAKKVTFILQKAGLIKSFDRAGYMVVGRPSLVKVMAATEGILPDHEGETAAMGAVREAIRSRLSRGLGSYIDTL